jgi:signal peptidase I
MAYRRGPIRRGDVVVLVNPNERYQDHIKRVVALPGDVVDLRDDDVVVNGQRLPHETAAREGLAWEINGDARYEIALDAIADPLVRLRAPTSVTVPNGHCFVLGDNRHRSLDSRDYGPVPLVDVIGRVDLVW